MDGTVSEVDKLLLYFNNCKRIVEKNKLVVDKFLKHLKLKSDKINNFFINGCSFVGVGSSYENTAVSPKSDFDIAMVLPGPFTTKFFQVAKTEEPGLFKLKCNTGMVPVLNKYLSGDKYLLTEVLRNAVFSELTLAMQTMKFEDFTVMYLHMSSSFVVKLKRGENFIKIDIVPQIEAKVCNIPGWNEVNIPLVIQDYIKKTDRHILFNLSCPPQHKNFSISHFVVQPSLNLLEKEAMLKSEVVLHSVCMFKALSKHNKWSSKGLRSFHIKRVALQLYEEIEREHRYPWVGFVIIMDKLTNMLQNGKIDSYFIKNHNIICTNLNDCQTLAKEISGAYSSISPTYILSFLEPLEKVEKNTKPPTCSEIPSSTQQVMKMPLFMERAAFNWFEMVDARFFVHKIIGEESKFYHTFAALPEEIVMKLSHTTITEHKFSVLKEAVIKICDTNKIEKFHQLVSSLEEKEKPSIFLKEIQLIAANLGVSEDCVRSKFLASFTSSIEHILHYQNEISLLMLGKLADDLITLSKSKDSVTKVVKRDPLDLGHHPVICSDHMFFGLKAVTCNIHCQWPNKEGVAILTSSRTPSRATSPTLESQDVTDILTINLRD